MKKLWLLVMLMCSVQVHACDDTLLALLTASDPSSEFSLAIRKLNTQITLLGTELNSPTGKDVDVLVQELMTAWLALSNRYNVNPPEIAKDDPQWAGKMAEAARRIGNISLLIEKKNLPQAHLECLALSGYLARFFDSVGMSPLKRSFLKASELFIVLDTACRSRDQKALLQGIEDLGQFLATFSARLATDTRVSFQKTANSLGELRTEVATSSEIDWSGKAQSKIDEARNHFQQFRARLLMNEWFPNIRVSNASQPNSMTASSPVDDAVASATVSAGGSATEEVTPSPATTSETP